MKEVRIRKMIDRDFEQVHKLIEKVNYLHLNKRPDIYIIADPLKYKDFTSYINSSKYICYIAEIDNIIIGMVITTIKEIKEEGIFKHRQVLFIESICVDKSYKRKGIGKILYNEIVNIAKNRRVDSVELSVWSFNIEAIKFYKKMGMIPKNIMYEYKIEK